MKTKRIRVGELEPNNDVLEIRPVNVLKVSEYRQHMRSGAQFPPVHIIKGTNMLVSGHHRCAAYVAEYGADYMVDAIEVDVSDPADIIEHAVRENIKHGLPLDSISKKRAVLRLSSLGRTPEQMAELFGVSVKRIEMIADMCVIVRGKPAAIKRGLEHIAGTKVSVREYETHNKRDRGVPAWQNANQLTRWIENGWVDMSDPKTYSAMEQLQAAIAKLFA